MTQKIVVNNESLAVMNRFDLTSALLGKLKNKEAVVAGIGHTNFDLWAAGRRAENFYMLGSMGLAFPIALGVALAQPQRHVFGLEGDGSLLMQVGSLATIAALPVDNLTMIVWDNQAYQITGAQRTATADGADLVAMARGAGLTRSTWARDAAHFDALVDEALAVKGKMFIACKTDDQPPRGQTHRDPALIRENFMQGLGVRDPALFK